MAVMAVAVALVDQASKTAVLRWLAPGETVAVIGDWFRFRLLFNPGAAFSFGTNATWVFTVIQIVFIVGVAVSSPRVRDKYVALGLALVAGGAAGNLCDRLFRQPAFFVGHVVDFISVGNFAVFNVADSAITIGVLIFLVATLFGESRATGEGDS